MAYNDPHQQGIGPKRRRLEMMNVIEIETKISDEDVIVSMMISGDADDLNEGDATYYDDLSSIMIIDNEGEFVKMKTPEIKNAMLSAFWNNNEFYRDLTEKAYEMGL